MLKVTLQVVKELRAEPSSLCNSWTLPHSFCHVGMRYQRQMVGKKSSDPAGADNSLTISLLFFPFLLPFASPLSRFLLLSFCPLLTLGLLVAVRSVLDQFGPH